MRDDTQIYEVEKEESTPDPEQTPIKDRAIHTQPYDLVVESLINQIDGGTIFLRPISERPDFQRRYVWTNALASRLIESILLNVPIPPCYLSQNEDYELDVIDGQQRLFSIYRFIKNQFQLTGLEVITEINSCRFHDLPSKLQRQLKTHTLRLVAITNKSHQEIKFDVFQRLNTNTVPLNAQELRNCLYRGSLNNLIKEAVKYKPWLKILNKTAPDNRMRDEELVLRFFAFHIHGFESYKTPQKNWLNFAADAGRSYTKEMINELQDVWEKSINNSLAWFSPTECFRRQICKEKTTAINRALFDLVMYSASKIDFDTAKIKREQVRDKFNDLLKQDEFIDHISRAVDHKKRTNRRLELWNKYIGAVLD